MQYSYAFVYCTNNTNRLSHELIDYIDAFVERKVELEALSYSIALHVNSLILISQVYAFDLFSRF